MQRSFVWSVNLLPWLAAVTLLIVGVSSSAGRDSGEFASRYFAAGDFVTGVFAAGQMVAGVFASGLAVTGFACAGVFAIGFYSAGVFSVGVFSAGVFSFGAYSVGIFAAGAKPPASSPGARTRPDTVAYGNGSVSLRQSAVAGVLRAEPTPRCRALP